MTINADVLQAIRVRKFLAKQGIEKRRLSKKPPKHRFPDGATLRYRRDIRALQKQIEQAVRDIVFPELPGLVSRWNFDRPDIRTDAVVDEINRMIDDVKLQLGVSLDPIELDNITGNAATDVNTFHKRETGRLIQSTLGIDIVANEPWLGPQIVAFRKENVNLISSMVGDELTQIDNLLTRSQRAGHRVEVIREQIQKQFGKSRAKADLIARDQVNKLNGELTQLRQTGLGIEKYTWRDSGDGRVRQRHRDLDGTIQSWNDPPVTNDAGDTNHPGGDYQCRCYAEPLLLPILQAS